MRRNDKEITERETLDWILEQARVCHLGLCRDNRPYVVPLSYGYDGRHIYFHTAREGTKLDIIDVNPYVCFELEHDVRVIPKEDRACGWSFSFYSIIGTGLVSEIIDPAGKTAGLNKVMQHYSGREWDIDPESVATIRVWRIEIEQMTGKKSKDKPVSS